MEEEGATVLTDFRYCTFSFCVCGVHIHVCVYVTCIWYHTKPVSGISLQCSSILLFEAGSLSQTRSSCPALGSPRLPFKAGITVDRLPRPPGI